MRLVLQNMNRQLVILNGSKLMDASKANTLLGIPDDDDETFVPDPNYQDADFDDIPDTKPQSTELTVNPSVEAVPAVLEAKPHTLNQVDETFDAAKESIKGAIVSMAKVVEDAAKVALNTGVADQYSAVSSLVATLVQANKALVDIEGKQHSIHKREENEVESSAGPQITNNLNFHGTTQELQEFLKSMKLNGPKKETV